MLRAERCAVDPEVARDFPALALWMLRSPVTRGPRHGSRERLGELADRNHGAVGGRQRTPVAREYRAFARQIGVDPDVDRNPLEQALLERLQHGGFRSRDAIADALLIGMLETSVPMWALDGDSVSGFLRVSLAEHGGLRIADDRRGLAPLLGEPAHGFAAHSRSESVVVYALRTGRVSDGTVGEALWITAQWLAGEAVSAA